MKNSLSLTFLFLCFLINITLVVEGLVPLSKTFKFVNQGELSNGISTENNAQFLSVPQLANYPFQLCFFTTGKSVFTLGLSMGFGSSGAQARKDLRRWVWAANTNRPVGENATLTFGRNGNLFLANTDGRVVWQTQTANKNVTDIKLLSDGNLVLLDKNVGFVWHSFDYPTDTLLNGQAINGDGSNKLVSGSYSMVVDWQYYLTLSFKYKKEPLVIYHTSTYFFGDFAKVSFFTNSKGFGLFYETTSDTVRSEKHVWAQPGYATTLSMLRLDKDGNLRAYTYNWYANTWEDTFSYFPSMQSECNLPEKCGVFGLCKNSKCVSCPSSKGLMDSWSKECKREKIPLCDSSKLADYYKLEDVSSAMRSFKDRDYKKMTIDECKMICSKDYKCTGFFYRKNEDSCLVATTEIFTLTSDYNGRHEIGIIDPEFDTYIKYAK
ncbi:epidermis-specific secreted glycoprotein EP1-like [Papaver somniferum]|uniref:epidermis-specific secreted glycoprotein EP1-like n=1 Tax=Papaver somniferum TaxID=3469 RepID=UPI000E6FCB46|nr:epidermis-specific secreted glycoprotein EP1-like [Papaver somniferum]